ncbi:hypothetical protein XM38_003170 [Halomicronema hongdechloris C2206]|uniref:Uncharacterized protein n=1 Tax=Halomicronema hongdechloris C2206 TaxID=1641165 RepID=A0A1Z3HGF8_9CYAN|nr:hypothetical protein [Halomicronema hongdechloris]ASC69390.1 hypothetical protein XM38_003170 [Halomicronema hongdechloris C2206]
MMLLILVIVIALVAWALRLMERAIADQEFSLMLAGFLVASSAAAMMGVYFLMGNYMLYVQHGVSAPQQLESSKTEWADPVPPWLVQAE